MGYQSVNLENEPGISPNNYAENFKAFLAQRQPGQPFSFWISPWEPHRAYDPGIGRRHGVNPDTLILPPFLPDHPDVRSDVADYLYEIEWMDAQISKSLEYLRETGELDNTLIVYTSDNGMPFPRAKSNNYTYGVRVPLAMRWGHQRAQGLILEDMVSLTDLAPTFLDMAGVPVPDAMTGRSLKGILNKASRSGQFSDGRAHAFTGFERHIGDARAHNRGYPSRAIHTQDWIYIINLAPERSPAGPPKRFADIDDGSPTKEAIIQLPELDYYLQLATAKRPEEELYDLKNDLGQLNNLADSWRHYLTKYQLRSRLLGEMRATADPHTTGHGADFDTYTYYGKSYAKRSNKPTPDDVKDTGTVQSFAGDNIRWNHIILYTIAGIGLIFALFFVFRKKTKS